MTGATLERYRPSNDPTALLSTAVIAGLWPWKPDLITWYAEFDIDFNRYTIVAEVRLPNARDRIFHKVWIPRDLILDGNMWALDCYDEFIRGFRQRESIMPESNVILGEN